MVKPLAVDLSLRMSRREEEARLALAQERILQLRLALGGHLDEPRLGPPVCVVFEGWDAAGKGGAIRRLVLPLDPRHVRVIGFSKPTSDEKRHHFLWRFFPGLPGWGDMTIFDRSWYGRVLVERVEGFATAAQWERAYHEINWFEKTLVDDGMIIIKFWMHISHEEQERRFARRANDPLKNWKLGPEDWRNRKKRELYEAALAEMLERTETGHAPWDLVEAEDKRWARVKVLETVIERVEAGMRREGVAVPERLPESPRIGAVADRWPPTAVEEASVTASGSPLRTSGAPGPAATEASPLQG